MLKLCLLVLLPLALAHPGIYKQNTPENIARLQQLKSNELAEELSGQFEGDIILTDDQWKALHFATRNGLINERYRWPNRTVPYAFSEDVTAEQQVFIRSCLDDIEQVTCVRFVVRSDEEDYVRVQTTDSGCYSYVGRINGAQTLNLQTYPLDTGCFRRGTVIHEFLHAIGFYHMQSSSERDEHVRIIWENIQQGTENNFNKYDDTVITNFGEQYDYGSVMHYGATAFSINGEYTIIPINEQISPASLGQRYSMSPSDIRRIRWMYNCPWPRKDSEN